MLTGSFTFSLSVQMLQVSFLLRKGIGFLKRNDIYSLRTVSQFGG